MKHIKKNSLALLSAGIIVLAGCGKLNEEIAGLRSELGTLTERVAAIENTQIKALDEQIASIEKEVASLQAADKVLSDDVSELEGKMKVVTSDLATLKNSVSALENSSEELSGKIDAINTKISQMETKITSILSSIEELKSKIEAARVTLSYIPKYSDNVERVQITRDGLKIISGSASFWFSVSPESAAETIAKNWESSLSALSFYTLTKADGGDAAQMSVTGASVKDGILAITVNADKLGKDFILGNLGATVAIKVSCGDIKTVSPYFNLAPAMEEEALITYLLKNFDSDGDGQIETEKMSELTSLNISGMGISSLDGVLENMPALTSLDCSNNNLTSLDLSKNEKLTSVNLTGNANLTKVVCKSFEWFEACSISADDAALFYLSDGTPLTVVIDGNRWMNFNVGASESNLYGSSYNFDNAQTACPTGWRVPTKDELTSLSANYSDGTTYKGVNGRWLSGSQAYSSNVSAIFLPASSSSRGGYWSSTERGSSGAYCLYFNSVGVYVGYGYERSYEWSVRCLKD